MICLQIINCYLQCISRLPQSSPVILFSAHCVIVFYFYWIISIIILTHSGFLLSYKSYLDPFSLSNLCPKSLLPFIETPSKGFCIAVSNHSSEMGRGEWVGWLIMSYKLKKMENQSQGGLGKMHVNGFLGVGSKSLNLYVLL